MLTYTYWTCLHEKHNKEEINIYMQHSRDNNIKCYKHIKANVFDLV